MFDLDARVHLDEIETAIFVQEFEGAGAAVADAFARLDAETADFGALFVGDARRRRFLDDFLVAALHRAIAFAEMAGIALTIGQPMELDVARELHNRTSVV